MPKIRFKDHKDFTPNLTPEQIFKMGSFGGTYWRPIKSKFYKTTLRNKHKKFKWDIDENLLTRPFDQYEKKLNKYGVKVGLTLEYWEDNDWIDKQDPYGWMQWYCEFYYGRRTSDDIRQIKRWKNIVGPNGRFKKRLINMIKNNRSTYNDFTVSPGIRQTMQHWGVKLTKADMQ